jgi:pyruvate/2-oxoglutarate dehydrogenase complex dihydrolipoamide acyltransferase (E2) component
VRSSDLQPPAPTEAHPSALPPSPAPAPVAASGVPVRAERLPRAKRTEARYLRSGFETTLASVVTVSCPTRGLRDAVGRFPALGGNTTALVVFEAARLLRAYPALNAYHADGTAHYYEEVHVGFAVDAGRGLKVPVIHNADRKGVAEIAEEIRDLVVAYLDDALPISALAGGTFTITDLSGEGVTAFHPLINQGQSAILGVCAEVLPRGGREGAFNLVLAFDHQLSEGRAAGRFLGELRDRLAHYESAAAGSGAVVEEPRCSRCQAGYRELAGNGHSLVQTVALDGSTRLLCKLCFEGWV